MSTQRTIDDTSFRIPKASVPKLVEALKRVELFDHLDAKSLKALKPSEVFELLVNEACWEFTFDKTGSIDGLATGDTIGVGWELPLIDAMAPFVAGKGSIGLNVEGTLYRVTFKGGEFEIEQLNDGADFLGIDDYVSDEDEEDERDDDDDEGDDDGEEDDEYP